MACGLLLCIVHLHTTTEPSFHPSTAVEQTLHTHTLTAHLHTLLTGATIHKGGGPSARVLY